VDDVGDIGPSLTILLKYCFLIVVIQPIMQMLLPSYMHLIPVYGSGHIVLCKYSVTIGTYNFYFIQVYLLEMETPSPAPDTISCVRSLQLKDRAVLDKALRAFVSHIQAYAKHECNVILRLKGKT
jgi:hypothetical protein